MQETQRKWFAVRTKARQEEIAAMHYMRQGFSVYSPKAQSIRRHARKTEQLMRPLFPGYIFLHFNASRTGLDSNRQHPWRNRSGPV
jgi:transcriptional antiterminator RfaH